MTNYDKYYKYRNIFLKIVCNSLSEVFNYFTMEPLDIFWDKQTLKSIELEVHYVTEIHMTKVQILMEL